MRASLTDVLDYIFIIVIILEILRSRLSYSSLMADDLSASGGEKATSNSTALTIHTVQLPATSRSFSRAI